MKSNKIFSTRNMVLIALMTALMCILSPVSLPLPFTPVPITLAVLIVYFCAYVLDPISSLICILLYLLLGLVGFPKNIIYHVLAMTLSVAICLILGTFWFVFRKEGVTFIQGLSLCVIPFIPGAIIKIIIAAIAGPEILKRIKKIQ